MKLPSVPKLKINIKLTAKVLAVIAVAVALLAILGATYNAMQTNAEAKDKQHKAALKAAEDKGYQEGIKDKKSYVAAYELQRLQCQKGLVAYNALPTQTLKNKTPKPDCSASVL